MSWEAQTRWPQQRHSVCAEGSRGLLFFSQRAVGFKGKTPTAEVVGKPEAG